MTLLDDIRAEQVSLDSEIDTIVLDIIKQAHLSVESIHTTPPLVFGIAGSQTHVYQPHWRSTWEKKKILTSINKSLEEQNTTASIFTYTANFKNSQAVVISIRTPGRAKDLLLPFTIKPNGHVTWFNPQYASQPLDSLTVTAACVN